MIDNPRLGVLVSAHDTPALPRQPNHAVEGRLSLGRGQMTQDGLRDTYVSDPIRECRLAPGFDPDLATIAHPVGRDSSQHRLRLDADQSSVRTDSIRKRHEQGAGPTADLDDRVSGACIGDGEDLLSQTDLIGGLRTKIERFGPLVRPTLIPLVNTTEVIVRSERLIMHLADANSLFISSSPDQS